MPLIPLHCRDARRLLGGDQAPQLLCTRCTLYVPDAEVAWMRSMLPAAESQTASLDFVSDPVRWAALDTRIQLRIQQAEVRFLPNARHERGLQENRHGSPLMCCAGDRAPARLAFPLLTAVPTILCCMCSHPCTIARMRLPLVVPNVKQSPSCLLM